MRAKTSTLLYSAALLLVLSALSQRSTAQTAGQPNMTFYLHTSYETGVVRHIMSTSPPYGMQQSGPISQELVFVLEPILSARTRISGAVTFNLWLVATSTTVSVVNVTLIQRFSEGNESVVCSMESPLVISAQSRAQPYSLAVGPIIQTFREGSTLELRINARQSPVPVSLVWDGIQTGSNIVVPLIRQYYAVMFQVQDEARRSLSNANLTIMMRDRTVWTGRTDSKGEAVALLSQGDAAEFFDVFVYWKGFQVGKAGNLELAEGSSLLVLCRVYDLSVVVYDALGTPLSDALVGLADERDTLSVNRTGPNGQADFVQLPEGAFTLDVEYQMIRLTRIGIAVHASMRLEVPTKVVQPWFRYILVAAFLSVLGTTLVFSRRTLRAHRTTFGFLIDSFGGSIPEATTVMIAGNPGSGKTVLMQKLLQSSLVAGRRCLFISNQEFPEKILDDMIRLGLDVKEYRGSRLLFIDWYSGTAGRKSTESLFVPSLSDLTGLGTQLSAGISKLGEGTLVFLDSIGPLLAALTEEQVLSFIHAIGARVKGQGGTLFFSTGIGLDPDFLSRLESTSDCIIQLESIEHGTDRERRLRIGKLRGQRHSEAWVRFSIERGEGFVFYTTRRMA